MEILKNRAPQVASFTVAGSTTHNLDFGGQAGFVMIQNLSSGHIFCKPNGISTGFTVAGNTTMYFQVGDLLLTSLLFDNSFSGSTSVNIEVLYGV